MISPSNLALIQCFFSAILFLDVVEQTRSIGIQGNGIQGAWQQERLLSHGGWKTTEGFFV
jgi:hypothetical protein